MFYLDPESGLIIPSHSTPCRGFAQAQLDELCSWELLGAVTIRTVKHSRTILDVSEDFHRHMEPGTFWQETGVSKTSYGSQNQRETHFSDLVFITVSLLIEETLKYWSIHTKVEGGTIKFSLHLS